VRQRWGTCEATDCNRGLWWRLAFAGA
jgi:hypothetical protein